MKSPKYFSSILMLQLLIGYLLMAMLPLAGCADPKNNNLVDAGPNDSLSNNEPIRLTLPLAFQLPHEVRETSGLVFYNGKLWTHNDSNHLPVLYAIDTATAEVVQRVTLSNAQNVDWEEITMDDAYLYIGDFGNNRGTRTNLGIYRIRLDQLPQSGDASIQADFIAFTYPDQTSYIQSNVHNFDCEAFIAYNSNLYLFSKNRGDQQTKLYRVPAQPGSYTAELLDTFDSKGLITGSAYHVEKNEIVLVGYVNQIWTPFIWVLYDFEAPDFFGGKFKRINLINMFDTQIEGVCYYKGKRLFISSEERPGNPARVFRFTTIPITGIE
jgi:hypothetical protein